MMNYSSYAVVGTGALGGYYGACLQRAGAEVHFLLRSDFEHVRQHGLRIESPQGDFTLPTVNAYRRAVDMPPCQVVLLALKATQNKLLPRLLPPLLQEDGLVLVLQNGLGVEETAARVAGPGRVIGGLCFICSNKVGPGHICHLDYGQVTMAEYTPDNTPGGLTDRLHRLQADFEQDGVPVVLVDDLLTARWKKLVWNIPFNGLSVVLNAKTSELINSYRSRSLAAALMREVLNAAAAVHERHIPDSFIQEMLEATARMKPYRTSMKVDYDASRPMEVEAIFGVPFNLARQAGLKTPHLGMLYHQLRFLDERNHLD